MTEVTRVVLIEDHRLVREALAETLSKEADISIVGEAGDVASALALVASLAPDLAVVDINLPDGSGVELARQLRVLAPRTRLVALSAYSDKCFVTEMLRAGVLAYVPKSAAGFELVQAIRTARDGQSYLSADLTAALGETVLSDGPAESRPLLGRREREVLYLIAQGLRTPAIATQLCISPMTVDVHRRNIMRKLSLHTVADLTRYAIRAGLTPP